MSLGAPAPIEVVVSGRNLADSSTYMDKLREQFDGIGSLRDVQVQQSLHYPTVQVTLDRERAGLSGVTARDIGESLIAATYSSRYTVAQSSGATTSAAIRTRCRCRCLSSK